MRFEVYESFWKHVSSVKLTFYNLLKLTRVRIVRERHPEDRKYSRDMKTCIMLLLLFDLQSLSDLYDFNWLDSRSLQMKLRCLEFFSEPVCRSSNLKLKILVRLSSCSIGINRFNRNWFGLMWLTFLNSTLFQQF